jgi:hypothetical protein
MKMATKKIAPLEVIDTGEIPIVSIDIPTDYEALLPDPVPASAHVNSQTWASTPYYAESKFLPLVATVIASVVTGAALISIGILIGSGL